VTTTDRGRGEATAELVDALSERNDEQTLELAAALAELSGLLLDSEPLSATLQRVAELARTAVPGCTAAGVTLLQGDRPLTAAATDELTLEVDTRQYAADEGPCLDAARHGRVNRVDLREADQRWPDFAAHAREVGIRSYLAAPLVVRETSIGSLNLYSASSDGFDALDDALVGLFCAQASIALANAQLYDRTTTLAEQLRTAMASRALIEQAKGVLMAQHRVDADAAFVLLRERSQRANRKLRDVAQQLLDELVI
jgi:GAF domain-containing protein